MSLIVIILKSVQKATEQNKVSNNKIETNLHLQKISGIPLLLQENTTGVYVKNNQFKYKKVKATNLLK